MCEWRAIPSTGGVYEASADGRVRRAVDGEHGASAGYVLKPIVRATGYNVMSVQCGGKKLYRYVHRLVAEAFLGPIPDGLTVNHLDGNKSNNAVANLEYVTITENIRHAIRTGLRDLTGERNPSAKITADMVREIRRLYSSLGIGHRRLAERMGLNRNTVWAVVSGGAWRSVAVVVLAVLFSGACSLHQAKFAAYAGVTADLATTQRALDIGLREANPIIAATGEPLAFSAVTSLALLGGAAWAEQYDEKGATWFYRFVAFTRGGMAVWNASRIIKHHNHRPTSKAPPVSVGMTVRF